MSKSWYVLLVLLLVIAAIAASVFLPRHISLESRVATSSSEAVSSTTPATSSPTSIPPKHINALGTVNGTILLGPTCPVEHNPPEPQCADKPYQTSIRISEAGTSASYRTISSTAQGTFSVDLAAGSYTFAPVGGGGMPPTCRIATVNVTSGQMQKLTLSCDTGIR